MYDYLIVGAGLFGSVFAHEAALCNKNCLVIDKRSHIGGNCYTRRENEINIHMYGAHIFHTDNKFIWDYIRQFAEFNHFVNSPIARYHNELYNLPFNMNTFHQMWGVFTPAEAFAKINEQRAAYLGKTPLNLEEQAISLVGTDIYEKLIKGYTQKQWGVPCDQLPASIIRRLPVRFTYDNNYFNDRYQGIPIGGYTPIFEKLLNGIEVRLNTDYLKYGEILRKHVEKVIYTGSADALLNYKFGALRYRGLRFETEVLDIPNYQGCAAVNYTDAETPFTRIIEHKHFEFGNQPNTIITREYPMDWHIGDEPYYPVSDEENQRFYERYVNEIKRRYPNVILGGRLGEYRYYDMHVVIASALRLAERELISKGDEK